MWFNNARDSGTQLISEAIFGFGVIDKLGLLAVVAAEAQSNFEQPSATLGGGLLSRPLDGDHFDLDVLLTAGVGGSRLRYPFVMSAIELNFDSAPNLAEGGAYLRPGVTYADTGSDFDIELSFVAGGYWTFRPDHQLIFEFNSLLDPKPITGEKAINLNRLALGYNAVVTQTFEIIAQLHWDPPLPGKRSAFGATLGFIATVIKR